MSPDQKSQVFNFDLHQLCDADISQILRKQLEAGDGPSSRLDPTRGGHSSDQQQTPHADSEFALALSHFEDKE